ncbi:uncharacterized protein LOC113210630 isoform X3 [Frankliniella occidentalis]|uniref:Uncharacterized protein LOC113210630 isoform X3 n=1 Tax=Frankliniella occidentalis TaxID=133901 RepID=A0A9C6X570_FRAOC|nr:uncharacterized protein LOC113210630 isoform X3 [Frankliniella occidentalis]
MWDSKKGRVAVGCGVMVAVSVLVGLVIYYASKNHIMEMGMASRNCKAHSIGKPTNYVVLEGIAALIETENINNFDVKFEAFCILLLSKKKGNFVMSAASRLRLGTRSEEMLLPEVVLLDKEFEKHRFKCHEKLADTPFATRCLKKLKIVKDELSCDSEAASSEDSQAFCPKFLNIFIKKYASLIPLWTGMMSKERGDPTSSVNTNADVESHFKDKKNTVHKISFNKVGRYVKIERIHVKRQLRKVENNLITNSKIPQKETAKRGALEVNEETHRFR